MRILVDAMGGDNAPDQIALGAIQAAKDFNCEVVLVGRGEAILRALKDQGIETLPKGVEIANADDVVDMHDDPATVVKKKKDSSMVVGLNMLKEGGGDAFVSAGSTGALLSAATLTVRRVKGIRRAAMAPQIPTKTGREAVLIDCGATADCTPEFLLQFAFMGSYYAEKVLGIENPRVALLNIGAEDSKGGELQKAVYPLLKQAGETGAINFTGNIEARDVPLGGADVVVADGFSGNILLKGIEGTALFMASMMKNMFKKNVLTKLAALLCMDGVKAFKKKMDYRETGGTALIGLSKPVIKDPIPLPLICARSSSSSISCPAFSIARIIVPELYRFGGEVSPSLISNPSTGRMAPFFSFCKQARKAASHWISSVFSSAFFASSSFFPDGTLATFRYPSSTSTLKLENNFSFPTADTRLTF